MGRDLNILGMAIRSHRSKETLAWMVITITIAYNMQESDRQT